MTFFLIAGEPSGDALGASLMAGLKTLLPDVRFIGVGGDKMQAEGMVSLFPMHELSIMGIVEVLPKYMQLKRRIRQTAQAALSQNIAALITIDSPDFCLRVAKIVKKARPDLRTIHYVAPSVWAWRPGRAAKMARVIDHVLALLPFEPPYMQAAGMGCDFVGHPAVNLPALPKTIAQEPRLVVLPGSRRGEVTRIAPVFGAVMEQVAKQYPHLEVTLPTLPHLRELVEAQVKDWALKPRIITDQAEKLAAFAQADAALAASGTVSLELAAYNCPMLIAYKMNPLTFWIMRRLVKIDTVTLVNIVSQTRVVPEFLQGACTPESIAPKLIDMLSYGDGGQKAAMAQVMDALGRGGPDPGLRAARAVLSAL